MLLLGDIVTPIIFILERKFNLKLFGKSIRHSRCSSALLESHIHHCTVRALLQEEPVQQKNSQHSVQRIGSK